MRGVLEAVLAAVLVAGCGKLPSLEDRSVSRAFTDTAGTRLGRTAGNKVRDHGVLSGIFPLPDARDAFAARVLLTRAAERSLDVQYYIWRNDATGALLFQELLDAANRGVRIRLLLDDNNTSGLDATLAALDAHPNIEIRLFNPFVSRSLRIFDFLTDFSRLNRRMHNKSFTFDNQVTIVGGRNVGDEYFGATEGVLFVDLDVMAIGPVVREVSSDFDRFWSSASAYPVDRLVVRSEASPAALFGPASAVEKHPEAAAYVAAVSESRFVEDFVGGRLEFEWAMTRLISDDPAKALGPLPFRGSVANDLREIFGEPVTELDLVSAYFVPTAVGVDTLVPMARRGVNVRVLTNALESTDVPLVHAGYAKRRKALLEGGVKLYEMRFVPRMEGRSSEIRLGSSGSSLHAKTFAADRSRVFVGSFNFDPRSARLNTELGFIIDSPALAGRIAERFETEIPGRAYEVHLSPSGDLYWTERRNGTEARHDQRARHISVVTHGGAASVAVAARVVALTATSGRSCEQHVRCPARCSILARAH